MTNDQNWKPCPPGTIQTVADGQGKSDRSETMTRRASLAMVGTVAAGISYALWTRLNSIRTLTCEQTRKLAERYVLGQLNRRDSAAVDAHCKKCHHCSAYIAELSESLTT